MGRVSVLRYLAVLFLCAAAGVRGEEEEFRTESVIFIARHGARAPSTNMLKLAWVQDYEFSQLTREGKLQQYLIGHLLREDYKALFGSRPLQ